MTATAAQNGPTLDLPRRRILLIFGALMLGVFLAALERPRSARSRGARHCPSSSTSGPRPG
jgi:hypothetical protein